MDTPHLRLEESGESFALTRELTTIGRGEGVDISLEDPSVSRLHDETMKVLRQPGLAEELKPLGIEPMPVTPAEFDALIAK